MKPATPTSTTSTGRRSDGIRQSDKNVDPGADLEISSSKDDDITEKFKHAHHVDHLEVVPDSPEVKRLIRKIDIRLLPALGLIYAFALIDRVNLPNARIAGMDEDLHLYIGERYSLITMMFFIPYILFQFPANIIIRRIGAALWLGSLVVAWGALSVGMGFTQKWDQLLGCRVILGILEAGYFPGCVFLLSCWYVRFEVQKRFGAFYLLAMLAGGMSSLLALGLSKMKGLGGLNGWRWIFEGLITVVLGIMGFVAIIDFPDKAHKRGLVLRKPFLTVHEANLIMKRIDRDRGDATSEPLTFKSIMVHLKDWKIWEFAWIFLLNNVVTYSFGYFLPIILKSGMGYSTTMSQVLSFPPYAFACVWLGATSWFGDKYRKRGIVLIFNASMTLMGVAMMGFLKIPRDRYVGAFIGVAAVNSNVACILSYMHNNIVGQPKRALASAMLIGGGACGGVAASNIFRQADAPNYRPAMYAVLGTQALTVLHVLKNFYVYSRLNKKADRGEIIIEGQEGFRHTL